jgi:hypothetical protein
MNKSKGNSPAQKKDAQLSRAAKKAKQDRRTNRINLILVLVFVLGILACVGYTWGVYLPYITVLSTEGYDMNAVTFNYFYRDCYDSFQSAYGELLQAYGTIDTDKGLDEQDYSSGYTWAEFFYDTAVSNAQRTMTAYVAAQSVGYQPSDDIITDVDQQIASLKAAAHSNGYTSVNRFLCSHYGKGATLKSYRDYLLLDACANNFSSEYYRNVTYSDGELEAWFAENYADADDTYSYNTVNFRLVYLPFSGYEYDDSTGTYGYSQDAKQTALVQLQTISTQFVQGDQSEDSFAELATAYSAYKSAEGGLYENATKDDSDLEQAVINWIFTSGRRYGDTDYVEADSGVYLLYWIGEDMPAWQYMAQKGLRTEAWNDWYDQISSQTTIEINPNVMKYLYYAA